MARVQLTQHLIDNLKCPIDKSKQDYFDLRVTGLLVSVYPTGKKTYYLRYLNDRKKTVQKKLADASLLKIADARDLATRYLGQIIMGSDPFAAIQELKKVPKLKDFIHEQYLPYIKTYKRSWIYDEGLIRNHVEPNFGTLYMDELTKQDVVSFISRHLKTHAPGSVNRVIILLRYIYNLAVRWEVSGITKNPTSGIALLKENNKKERYLTADEAKRLIAEVQYSKNKMLQYIVPALILTGARKSEILKARWAEFNIEQRLWRITMSKSGKARFVPISDGLLQVLNTVPRFANCPYVFPNPKTKQPFHSIYGTWDRARTAVGLGDVRCHDLRHSFASFLVNSGRSLYEVQKILGHSQISTTERYAHLSQDSLLSAANSIGQSVPSLMPIAKSSNPDQIPVLEMK